jgi:hypothetical protein
MDNTPKPLGDWLPAFGRNGVPLVRKARGIQHDFEPVKRAVADKRFFAGKGRYSNVFQRLKQLLKRGSGDGAFLASGARRSQRVARRIGASDDQGLLTTLKLQIGFRRSGRLGYTNTVRNVRPIADMPDLQQGTFAWLAKREGRIVLVVHGSVKAALDGEDPDRGRRLWTRR